ncbi:MAG: YkvA family protein [Candidatus Promineifilaceae bacterium]
MSDWHQRVRQLKAETYALFLAYKDPRVPWYARLWAAVVVGYALSPIDLIPDFIPVLGYLDDLVLIPLGILLAIKLIPAPVMAECRTRAQAEMARNEPATRAAVLVIIVIWLALTAVVVSFFARIIK